MPIIGHVGRRSWKVRYLNISIHLVLLLGGVTMVYPFLVMFAGSLKSKVDRSGLEVIPAYFYDDEMLHRKYIETKYNELTGAYAYSTKRRLFSFEDISFPKRIVPARARDWNAFLDEALPELNDSFYDIGHAQATGVAPESTWRFCKELKAEPDVRGDIEKLNAKYGSEYVGWEAIGLPDTGVMGRKGSAKRALPFLKRALEFINSRPREDLLFRSVDAFFIEDLLKVNYTSDIRKLNKELGTDFRSWREVCLTRTIPDEGNPLRKDWTAFVKEKLNLAFIEVTDGGLPAYRNMLREKYDGNIEIYNKRYGTSCADFAEIQLPKGTPDAGIPYADWDEFIVTVVDPAHVRLRTLEFMYRDFLRRKYETVETLNTAQELGLSDFSELALPARYPDENTTFQDDWHDFAVTTAEPDWLYAAYGALFEYRRFLTKPFAAHGDEAAAEKETDVDFAALNAAYATSYTNMEDIQLPKGPPENPELSRAWSAFLREACPPKLLRIRPGRAADAWQQFLRKKYAAPADLNTAYGFGYEDFDHVVMPIEQADYFAFQHSKRHVFVEFLTRNYRVVLDVMLYSGRAILNTIIYCGLAVVAALIVNPLAAYALSRYKPPSAYKVLLFCMLTMAFPPMVLGIPNFLLVRKLGLLNTFACLILPGMANGYSIFLLKGFFDSLPRELYESASLDGASEWTMFWSITMATSKPILAVIALGAFTMAYGNFMMAFILCQNPRMWTMMVNAYQLMQRSNADVGYAVVVIAAIPTFIVFVFCQNIIIRGIVVPTEK